MLSTIPILLQSLPIRWGAPWLLPAVLGIGAALTAAVLWYYPGQVKLVRRPWRYIIPLLRLLAFTALAVSIAQPIALRARPAEDKGALIVLIDRSASMSIADGSRRPSDLVAVADALGLLPPGARAESSAAVTAEFEQLQAAVGQAIRAQGDLDYARVSGRGIEAAEARVRKSVEEGRALGRSLASRLAELADDGTPASTGLREKLEPLADLPIADLRGGWIAETRRRLEQTAAAMTRFQDLADRKLYDSNDAVRLVCEQLERRSRLQLTVEALVRPGGLLSRIGPETPVLLFAFDDNASPLPPTESAPAAATLPSVPPVESAAGMSRSLDGDDDDDGTGIDQPTSRGPTVRWTSNTLPIQAVGSATDIPGALAQALAATGGRPLRGVLVISDGQQVGGSPGSAAAALLPPGVPLITVSAAGALPPRDIAVSDIEAPAAAFVGETILVRTRIRGTGGLAVDPTAVRLAVTSDSLARIAGDATNDPDDDAMLEFAPMVVGGPGGKAGEGDGWAQFSITLDRPGIAQLSAAVPPMAGEVSTANNTSRRWVKVLPERIRVAAYAGSAGWDFQYLRSALGRRNWFAIEAGVLNPAKPRLPLSPAQILQKDVLILYDMPVEALDREQWYAVDRLVMRRGGSVVFVAGPGFNPGGYIDQPLASSLLPFNLQVDKKPGWRQWPGDRPSIRLLPGPEYLRSDVLRLADADLSNRRWHDLPGAWRVLPVRAARPGVKPILRDGETGQAVVTEMKPGAGKAFYVGTHETWRWRQKNGEDEHERFWRQLVRYAAEEPYAAQSGRLSLDLDEVSVTPGTQVQARVRVLPASPQKPSAGDEEPATQAAPLPSDLRLAVYRLPEATRPPYAAPEPAAPPVLGPLPDASQDLLPPATRPALPPVLVSVVKLPEIDEDGGRARVSIGELPAGRYEVRLGSASAGNWTDDWPALPLRVEASLEPEMKNLTGDADRLRRMAESTGGRLLRIDQLSVVPGLLAAAADQRPRVVEWSLWDSPWLFVFVVGCLGAEWALRKRAGLA